MYEDVALNMQSKYVCSFVIAAAVATVAAAGVSIYNGVSGGGGGSAGGSVGGSAGGSSGPASYNPGSTIVASQAPLQQQSSVAAANAYDPSKQMDSWTSIFSSMPTKPSETTNVPNVNVPPADPTTSISGTGGPS